YGALRCDRQAVRSIPSCQHRRTTLSIYKKWTAILGCCKPWGQPVGGRGGRGMRAPHVACLAIASCLAVQGCGGTAFDLPPVSDREALLAAQEIDANPSLPQFPRGN